MVHGHLYLPRGVLQIEAFVHDGHQYTYFGLFPSLIRMPVLLLTNSLDGKLTAPSLLLAWLVAGTFSCLLLWRVRILIRGRAALGYAEAASYGLLVATVLGGSVLMFLAASPFVYNEDFAWSVGLVLGSVFALLGVIEHPSWGRVAASGGLILAANLNRTPTGYACVIGAVLVAVWFVMGRGGAPNRRWALPMLAVGVVSLAVSCAVTWAKFGLPFGLPMADQVWAQVNAHRRYFLAANGGRAFSVGFIPSTVSAYFNPAGLRFGTVFPFVSLPPTPARAVGGVVLDQTYPTGSILTTMPLLFLLACWGAVTTFRPRGPGMVRLVRIPMLAAAAGVSGVLVWGYIADRYMSDFLPLLVLASCVAIVDIWRRAVGQGPAPRRVILAAVAVLTSYGVAANVALAVTPSQQFRPPQSKQYVTAQHSVTPQTLDATVARGNSLPYWGPADQLFVVGNCSGLYMSTGNTFKDVPGQQIQHSTWIPVEQGPGINHTIGFAFNQPVSQLRRSLPVMTFGQSTLVLEPAGPGRARFRLENPGAASVPWPSATGWSFPVNNVRKGYYQINVMTDPNLNSIEVWWYGSKMFGHYLAGRGPAVVEPTRAAPGGPPPTVSVWDMTGPAPNMKLCRSILRHA